MIDIPPFDLMAPIGLLPLVPKLRLGMHPREALLRVPTTRRSCAHFRGHSAFLTSVFSDRPWGRAKRSFAKVRAQAELGHEGTREKQSLGTRDIGQGTPFCLPTPSISCYTHFSPLEA